MLTVLKSPPLVALTGNPVRFTFHSDNTTESEAVQSRVNIYFSSIGFEDMTIKLSWGVLKLTFTCKPYPDNSGTQIPDATVEADLNDWVQLVSVYLLRNYYISRDWTIIVSGAALLMYGKSTNIGTPTVTFDWHAEMEPTSSTVAGELQKPRIFFKVGLRVLIHVDEDWVQIGEDILPVNNSSIVEFDIHTLFADYVFPEFLWPEISDDLMPLRPNSTAEYRVEYYEQYGNPIVPGIITRSDSFYALYGGISKSQEAVYNQNASSFWHKLTYNLYFLTWQPKYKTVTFHQVEKLYFLCQTEMTRISLRFSYYLLDGTSHLSQALSSIDLPPDKGVVELTISPWQVFYNEDYADTLDYFEVWIEYRAERISELRTFKIDRTYYENERYFLFLNSLGGYDTIRVTGDQEDALEYDRTDIDKTLPAGFKYMDHESATGFVKETVTYKANTGWINRDQLSWLRELFLSKQVFQIKGDKLMPVVVSSTKVAQRIDKEYMYSLDFEYRRSLESEFYSREITYQSFADDFANDFPNE